MSKVSMYDDLKNQPSEKIEAIKKILPDCFDKDGNLIQGRLKEVLTNNFEKPDTERFTFNWAGKQKAREIAYKTYVEGTLKFDHTRSKNSDITENLIIEGDNLQVLKLLKNSYKSKVKCIYIDPPYNTGNDFVYNDKFELDIKKYLIETGEIDEETGEQMADYIQKDDGKKHSKWLSFMYPRLMVAREMLREDGVIFISIDDNEVHHLRLLMNEVFGEREFFGCLTWISRTKPKNMGDAQVKLQHNAEYILVYGKNSMTEYLGFNLEVNVEKKYDKNDEFGEYRLEEVAQRRNIGSLRRDTMVYEILGINPKVGYRWQLSQMEYAKLLEVKKIINLNNRIFIKVYKEDENNFQMKPFYTHLENIEETAESAKKDLSELMNVQNIFDTVKPVNLVKQLIFHSTATNDLILDFFAGSGTTGQAVMELNQEELDKRAKDGLFEDKSEAVGGRKFILVQLPEKINEKKEAFKAGFKKISDITIERVKRAGEKYKSVDNGFKVLQLVDNPDRENLWSLRNSNDNEFILTHLALMYGYGLNYKLEKIAEKEIYIMKSEIEKTKDAIVIMEQKPLTMEDAMSLIKKFGKEKYKFFSRDSALNIELTYNLLQHFKEDNVIVF